MTGTDGRLTGSDGLCVRADNVDLWLGKGD